MTDLNGSMMNVPFLSRKPSTVLTALSAEHSSIRNTQTENRHIVRPADADWIGANYEHKAMREVQILENRRRRMRFRKDIQILPSSSRYRKVQRKKRR